MKDGAKILVAYDGSPNADRALSEAINLGKKFSSPITVLHVRWRESEESSKSLLKKTEETLKKAGMKYQLRTETGENIPRVIIRVADEEAFGLITMGTRGMGGVRAWIMGSVSNAVATGAKCPVLIVS